MLSIRTCFTAACCFIVCLLTFSVTAGSETLSLECFAIPNSNNQLCEARTQGYEPMYDDLLLFEKTQAGRFRFLVNEESSMVGQSYLWGVSQGGKYLVIESTEEGHAGYQIYEAEAFIEFPQTTHASFVVYDYYLPSLIALDDDGVAIFERMQDGEKHNHADCLTNIEDYEYEPDYPVCLVKIDLLALDAKN